MCVAAVVRIVSRGSDAVWAHLACTDSSVCVHVLQQIDHPSDIEHLRRQKYWHTRVLFAFCLLLLLWMGTGSALFDNQLNYVALLPSLQKLSLLCWCVSVDHTLSVIIGLHPVALQMKGMESRTPTSACRGWWLGVNTLCWLYEEDEWHIEPLYSFTVPQCTPLCSIEKVPRFLRRPTM